MADEIPGITVQIPNITVPGTGVGGTNPVTISPQIDIGGFGGGNAPSLGGFGINIGGQLGGGPLPIDDPYANPTPLHERNLPFFQETPIGSTIDAFGLEHPILPPDFDQRVETQTTEASIMPGLFDWLAPDTPGNQGAVVAESEDQWWDAPLEAVGDLVRPIAQYWINRGMEELYDWSMPGRTGGGTSAGVPQHPGSNQIIDVTPTREAPMAQVPTSLPGGAPIMQYQGPRPPTGGTSLGPVGGGCIMPGGAQIQQRAGMSMRLPSSVDVPTVDRAGNMRFTTFKNMGRPVLYAGDYAAAKRVTKVASKARRRRGGR